MYLVTLRIFRTLNFLPGLYKEQPAKEIASRILFQIFDRIFVTCFPFTQDKHLFIYTMTDICWDFT